MNHKSLISPSTFLFYFPVPQSRNITNERSGKTNLSAPPTHLRYETFTRLNLDFSLMSSDSPIQAYEFKSWFFFSLFIWLGIMKNDFKIVLEASLVISIPTSRSVAHKEQRKIFYVMALNFVIRCIFIQMNWKFWNTIIFRRKNCFASMGKKKKTSFYSNLICI